jgi:site-specific DNA recombinase
MKPQKQVTRAAIYARVSTEDQAAEDRFSIDAQLTEIYQFAKEREWEVVQEFIDPGVSGTKRSRPQLDLMLELAEEKEFDVIIVHELSRLSRSVFDTLDILQNLGKQEIGFVSVKEPDFDFTSPDKKFFLIILAAMNEYFISILKLHTTKAKKQRAREGLYNASLTPYGYEPSGDTRTAPIINEEEAKAVRLIYENYSTGRFSHQQVADLLKDAGYQPPSRRVGGKKSTQAARTRFSKETVRDILHNPFYMGKIAYRVKHGRFEEIFDGTHNPVIPQDLWERCQRMAEQRRSASRAVQSAYRVYLLSQLAICDVCHRSLRCQATKSGNYYREMSSQRGYTDCPHQQTGVRTEVVDKQIHAIIEALTLPQEWLEEITEQVGDDEELVRVTQQRERLEAKRRRLRDMRLEGDYDANLDEYKRELAELRHELDNLPTPDQIASLRSTANAIMSLKETWQDAEPVDQRDLLRLMFSDVQVDVKTGRVTLLRPEAVMIPILRQCSALSERSFGEFVPVWDAEQAREVSPLEVLSSCGVLPDNVNHALLPFTCTDLLHLKEGARIAPEISTALKLYKEAGHQPQRVVQVLHAGEKPLPADLRRWQKAQWETINLPELDAQLPDDISVLLTRYPFTNDNEGFDPTALIATVYERLASGGVWYLCDLLPPDMPANWVFQAFPDAWNWAQQHTWGLHQMHTNLQMGGFSKVQVKRHLLLEPMKIQSRLELARGGDGLLAELPEAAYLQGMQQLEDQIESEWLINSEVALLEVWAQKGA